MRLRKEINETLSHFLFSIAFLLAAFLYSFFFIDGARASDIKKSAPSSTNKTNVRQVAYSYTLRNNTNKLIPEAEFWTYAPVSKTSTQNCLKIDATPPCEILKDALGNQILYFKLKNIAPFASKIITINADVEFASSEDPETPQDRFLKKEKYLETDHPEIQKLAKRLPKVKHKFAWVSREIKYDGFSPEDRGALWALRGKKGDCTEFAYLFTALCRAAGVPARVIGGYHTENSQVLSPAQYHDWAEFHQNGRWVIADPQKRVFKKKTKDYIAMRIFDDGQSVMEGFHRFKFKGDGLKVKMN